MKKIAALSFIFFLSQTLLLNAQDNIFQESDSIKFHKLKSVQAFEYDTLLKKSGAYLSFVIDFDKEGNIIKHTNYSNNKPFQTYQYTYDKNNNLLNEHLMGRDGLSQYIKTYKYNKDVLIKEVQFKNGSFKERIDYFYNNSVEYPIKLVYTLADSSTYSLNYKYNFNPNNKLLSKYVNGRLKEEYQYDSLGQMVVKIEFNKDGNVKNKLTYQYYMSGELMQLSQLIPSEKTMYRWYYEYNKNKKLIKEKEYKSRSLKEYIYNDKGLLVEYIHYDDFKYLSNGCVYKYDNY